MSFVRAKEQQAVSKKQMFGGNGQVEMRHILNGVEEMGGKGRVFNHIVLVPGAEVAWHVHSGDNETYYILSGTGEYSDNGTIVTLHPGDTSFVGDGEGHSLKNIGDEDLHAIALILYT